MKNRIAALIVLVFITTCAFGQEIIVRRHVSVLPATRYLFTRHNVFVVEMNDGVDNHAADRVRIEEEFHRMCEGASEDQLIAAEAWRDQQLREVCRYRHYDLSAFRSRYPAIYEGYGEGYLPYLVVDVSPDEYICFERPIWSFDVSWDFDWGHRYHGYREFHEDWGRRRHTIREGGLGGYRGPDRVIGNRPKYSHSLGSDTRYGGQAPRQTYEPSRTAGSNYSGNRSTAGRSNSSTSGSVGYSGGNRHSTRGGSIGVPTGDRPPRQVISDRPRQISGGAPPRQPAGRASGPSHNESPRPSRGNRIH